nr:hypothetical protein [Pedobacter sp. ASV2]
MNKDYNGTTKNIGLQTLIFSICWYIYVLFAMPFADQEIGICEGTPGHDYSLAIIILPLYFALFGFWIFRLFKNTKKTSVKLIISILILIPLPLIFSVITIRTFYSNTIKDFIIKENAFDFFYKYGCYGDADLKYPVIMAISAILLWLSFFFLMTFIRKREVNT